MIFPKDRFTCNLSHKASRLQVYFVNRFQNRYLPVTIDNRSVNVIKQNAHKYSILAMFKILNIPRSTYYYETKQVELDSIAGHIIEMFHESDSNYGTSKIQKELKKKNIVVLRRHIGRIMKLNGLVSSYTIAQFKPHKTTCNEDKIKNKLIETSIQKNS